MADYLPKSESELTLWLANFNSKIPTQGLVVGLTAAEITTLTTDTGNLVDNIFTVEQAKADLKNKVAAKDTIKLTSMLSLRESVKRIKANPAYTDAIGQDLGIIGTPEVMDEEAMKPKLTGEAFPGYIRLKFTKKGLDGVNIYTRLKGQSAWIFLARDTNSPYDDNRALAAPGIPETREYMCIGVLTDAEVGQASDIVTVVFGG